MLITVRNFTNQPQIPELIPVYIRKKTVSLDPHRRWAEMGGLLHGGIGEMVERVSNKSLHSLGQRAKCLLMAQDSAKQVRGCQAWGPATLQGLLPAPSAGGSQAVGLHCLSGVSRALGSWAGSAPGSIHWPLHGSILFGPDSLPTALPWSSRLPWEAGSWASKAAESLRPTQTRPGRRDSSFSH